MSRTRSPTVRVQSTRLVLLFPALRAPCSITYPGRSRGRTYIPVVSTMIPIDHPSPPDTNSVVSLTQSLCQILCLRRPNPLNRPPRRNPRSRTCYRRPRHHTHRSVFLQLSWCHTEQPRTPQRQPAHPGLVRDRPRLLEHPRIGDHTGPGRTARIRVVAPCLGPGWVKDRAGRLECTSSLSSSLSIV